MTYISQLCHPKQERFPLNGLTGQTRIFYLYQWKELVYVSQISSENGPRSNVI
jgi:hypothetical protein